MICRRDIERYCNPQMENFFFPEAREMNVSLLRLKFSIRDGLSMTVLDHL